MSREGRKGIFHDRGLQTGTRNCEFCPHSGYCMDRISPFSKRQGASRSRRCRRSFIRRGFVGENIEGTTSGTITGTIAGHTVQAGTRC